MRDDTKVARLAQTLASVLAKAHAHMPDALMLAGASTIAYGAGLIYEPAGYIVGGLLALVGGVLLARSAG